MELPIKFPSEDDLIRDDVTRFRAMPATEQFRVLRGMLSSGLRMIRLSPMAESISEDRREQERQAGAAFEEVLAHHVNRT